MPVKRSYEYKNDFLYFVIRPRGKGRDNELIYCSGVNVSLFYALTKGRHGIGSNPAVRGLQLTNHGVREIVISSGATPRAVRGNDCAGIAPTEDVWYGEILAIDNPTDSLPDEIIRYGVRNLIDKIFRASCRESCLHEVLPGPRDLQDFLEAKCRQYSE